MQTAFDIGNDHLGRTNLIKLLRRGILDFPDSLRYFLIQIVDQPDQIPRQLPSQNFLRNVFAVSVKALGVTVIDEDGLKAMLNN